MLHFQAFFHKFPVVFLTYYNNIHVFVAVMYNCLYQYCVGKFDNQSIPRAHMGNQHSILGQYIS